jgi:hypothetical protein
MYAMKGFDMKLSGIFPTPEALTQFVVKALTVFFILAPSLF